MSASYGVVWQEGTSATATGKLELLPEKLSLDGLARGRPAVRELAYEALSRVRVGGAVERIGGRPTVVVEPRGGAPIAIAPVSQPGSAGEIAARLGEIVRAWRGIDRSLLPPGLHDTNGY
jgi:hypothetical protein